MVERGRYALYVSLRMLHLALTSSLVPLALWHLVGAYRMTSYGLLLLAWAVGVVTMVFIIAMDQADYPVDLGSAVVRTVPLLLSLAAGFGVGASPTLVSLSGVGALMSALALALTIGLRRELREGQPARLKLVVAVALAVWGTLPVVMVELLRQARVLPLEWALLWALAWLLHVGSATVAYYRLSSWGDYGKSPRSAEYHQRWGGPTAACYALAFVGSLVVVFWRAATLNG